MRLLSVVVALVLMASVGAFAHEGSGVELSGGVYFGNLKADDAKSNALGFYASAGVAPQAFPVALSASYATFSPDKITVGGNEDDADYSVNVFDLLAGYPVYGNLAVGAGWASATLDGDLGPLGKAKLTGSGLVVGAFGEMSLSPGIQASGKLLYSPFAKVKVNDDDDGEDATMLGLSISAEYELGSNFGVEAGYRMLQFKAEEADEPTNTGGFFIGATYAF